ncbi:tyrosine-type recombinase/integrase [Streptomyces sp. NPDC056821]|uniref:tyrosine-type recombinase/integrase n=1 Tax=Streptomyces sp. NPDC056821 TaxID=3345952 RepID=UPI00368C3573
MCARAEVRKIRFHDLRHTCASLLHEQCADARMIMEVLGHSSIRVTGSRLINPAPVLRCGCCQTLPSTPKPEALWITPRGLWCAVHSAGFEPATF